MRRVLSIIACCCFLLCGQVYADFESEVIDLVNVERAAEGIAPLSYDARLAAAARGHSEDMGLHDYFSHTSLDGRTVSDRITDAGYTWNFIGENIAADSRCRPRSECCRRRNRHAGRIAVIGPQRCDRNLPMDPDRRPGFNVIRLKCRQAYFCGRPDRRKYFGCFSIDRV